jgi:hypothetical protein
MIRATFLTSLTVITAFLMGMGSAAATPQMLAVAALENPQNLVCENGVCSVELSAICLQKNRRFPGSQSVYHPFDPNSIQLVIHDVDGNELRLVADDYAAIRSKRTFTAVTVRVDEDTLKGLGATDAAIVVAEDTTLVPDPIPFDNYPHTADEIAHAAGPLRILASGWLAGNGEQTVAAKLMNQMLNSMSDDDNGESLWQSATGLGEAPSDPGEVKAKEALDTCAAITADDSTASLRRCLELKHDSTMYRMNVDFWDASKTGS